MAEPTAVSAEAVAITDEAGTGPRPGATAAWRPRPPLPPLAICGTDTGTAIGETRAGIPTTAQQQTQQVPFLAAALGPSRFLPPGTVAGRAHAAHPALPPEPRSSLLRPPHPHRRSSLRPPPPTTPQPPPLSHRPPPTPQPPPLPPLTLPTPPPGPVSPRRSE